MAMDIFLQFYYKRMFPFKEIFTWLDYAHEEAKGCMRHREFAFVVRDTIFCRYFVFETPEAFRAKVYLEWPNRIEIGAQFESKPIKNPPQEIKPVKRELTFDLDLNDYDVVRSCCKGTQMCPKCWKFLKIAVKIIDNSMREHFGYQHILWVFSGRRGVHCWVCDREARSLSKELRSTITRYINQITYCKRENLELYKKPHLPHSVKDALKVIDPVFEEVCLIDQDMLGNQMKIDAFLVDVPDGDFKKELQDKWKTCSNTLDRWNEFIKLHDRYERIGLTDQSTKHLPAQFKINWAAPRPDSPVTSGLSHLLKAPFCIHPSTGKVCVPFNAKDVDDFDPFQVPNIDQLMNDIEKHDVSMPGTQIADVLKTRMAKHYEEFKRFIDTLQQLKGAGLPAAETE